MTLDKEAKVGLNGGQMVFDEIAAELAPDYPPHPDKNAAHFFSEDSWVVGRA